MSENTFHIDNGGSMSVGNIGGAGGAGTVNHAASGDAEKLAVTVRSLLGELAQLRGRLVTTPDGPGAEPKDVDELIGILDAPTVDAAKARSKWERIVNRIPQPLRDIEALTRIASLLSEVIKLVN